MKLSSEQMMQMHKVFKDLLMLAELEHGRLCSVGKGADTEMEYGCVLAQSKGWLRVLEHEARLSSLDELVEESEELGLYE